MKNTPRLLWLLLLSAVFATAQTVEEPKARADKPPAAGDKKAAPAEFKEPVLSVTEHEVTIGGKLVKYRATAGYLVLKTEKDEPRANIFFVAYTKLGEADPAKRPLTFSFNGGPGSASVWLHMGALGPKRVVMTDKGESMPPPYQWADNPFSWLDETDLVFIDPVSTGYSRAAKDVDPKIFHGFTADIESVGEFIRLWTTRNQRWSSPKFIAGESYGTTRAAGLSDYLQTKHGIYLNGIVLISSIMNFETARFAPGNDLPYQLFLPTYTASAFYHGKLKGDLAKDLHATLTRVQDFVLHDYSTALTLGDALPAKEFDRIAQQVADFTGLSTDFVKEQNLRISIFRYVRELKRSERRIIGRLDSSITGIADDEGGPGGGGFTDPSSEVSKPGFTVAFNDYLRRELKFESDLAYETSANVRPWSYANVENEYLNVADTLKHAMTKNAFLKVWIANGYYDLATPYFATDYTVKHMGLDPAVRGNISQTFYEAGHMMYLHTDSLKKFKADYAAWMAATLKTHSVR